MTIGCEEGMREVEDILDSSLDQWSEYWSASIRGFQIR